MLPFSLDNTTASSAKTFRPNANAHIGQPLALTCSVTTPQEAPSSAGSPGFPQICRPRPLGPGRYTLTTLRQQLAEEWRGCFYTATEPNPDSKSDSYDPMRECFNIVDGAVATTDDTEDNGNAAAAPAARIDPRTPGHKGQVDPPPPQDDKAVQLMQLRELKAKLEEDQERLNQLEQALEQDQAHPHGGGA